MEWKKRAKYRTMGPPISPRQYIPQKNKSNGAQTLQPQIETANNAYDITLKRVLIQ